MHRLLLIFVLLFMGGCKTPQPTRVFYERVRDTVVIVKINEVVKFDTVTIIDTGTTVSKLATPHAISIATVKGGKLYHNIKQKDTVMQVPVKEVIREIVVEVDKKNNTNTANNVILVLLLILIIIIFVVGFLR